MNGEACETWMKAMTKKCKADVESALARYRTGWHFKYARVQVKRRVSLIQVAWFDLLHGTKTK